MNVFTSLGAIDDILDHRLRCLLPYGDDTKVGRERWIFVHEPSDTHVSELVRVLHPLLVDISSLEIVGNKVTFGSDTFSVPKDSLVPASGAPLEPPYAGCYLVNPVCVHILSAVRAALLVLVDSCHLCAKDSDFVGSLSAEGVLDALRVMSSWSLEEVVPNLKFWKDFPLARFLRNPTPPVPPSWHGPDGVPLSPEHTLFSGPLGAFLKRLRSYDSSRPDAASFYRALFGFSQLKRACATVPPSFVRQTMRKHRDVLSKEPPGDSPNFPESDLRAFTRSVLKGWRPPDVFLEMSRQEASTRASVESTRAEGGQREFIRRLSSSFQQGTGPSPSDPGLPLPSGPSRSMRRHLTDLFPPGPSLSLNADDLQAHQLVQIGGPAPPHSTNPPTGRLVALEEPTPGFVVEHTGLPPLSPDEWRSLVSFHIDPSSSRAYLPPRILSQVTALEGQDKSGLVRHLPVCRVAAVIEPLKVRLVTAMDGLRAFFAKPIQNSLWHFLRGLPQFRLIGEPITESILFDLYDRHIRSGGSPSDGFVSGDYSAATDNLDIRVSRILIQEISTLCFPDDPLLREFLGSSVLEQILVYPDEMKIPATVQRNGQLMGSIMSFPLLCLANLFAYVQSLEGATKICCSPRLLRRLPVLINGDDLLAMMSNDSYLLWQDSTSRVGFSLSVGKNFHHRRFLMVNSTPIAYDPPVDLLAHWESIRGFWSSISWYDMDKGDLESHSLFPSRLPSFLLLSYLNVGLLTGQSKLTGRERLRSMPLSGWYAASAFAAMNPVQAHGWFLHYHKKSILRQTRFGSMTLNLFAHPLLGGLGFPLPPGVDPGFSLEQRRLAQALFLSAQGVYEGRMAAFKLQPLLTLTSPTAGGLQAGVRPIRTEVLLYPIGSPLPEGFSPFSDLSSVPLRPLSHPVFPDSDEDGLEPKIHLTPNQIRRLVRPYTGVQDPMDLDKMCSFPFLPVEVRRTTFVESSDPVPGTTRHVRPVVELYRPDNVFQDVVSPDPDEQISPPKELLVWDASDPDDWEAQDIILPLPTAQLVEVLGPPSVAPSPEPPARVPRDQTARHLLRQEFNRLYGTSSPPTPRAFDFLFSRKGGRRWRH
nr:MAG: putative RNA-dependent RNA polymerase [Narnaviridae sp.]